MEDVLSLTPLKRGNFSVFLLPTSGARGHAHSGRPLGDGGGSGLDLAADQGVARPTPALSLIKDPPILQSLTLLFFIFLASLIF